MIDQATKLWLLSGSLLLLLIDASIGSSSVDSWTARKVKATQYHMQDPTSGAYQYGYTGPHHTKSESSVNGVTRGGYSYVDANGILQTVSYTADAENGFRVQASNQPWQQERGQQRQRARHPPQRTFSSGSVSHHYVLGPMYALPLSLVHSSMRHTQDTLGQYEYSYTGDTSAKTESRSLDGTTRGAYSYIDANGILQQVRYIADKGGFRVL